eukprot:1140572-Pelagomonas_calceolata.AAC.2
MLSQPFPSPSSQACQAHTASTDLSKCPSHDHRSAQKAGAMTESAGQAHLAGQGRTQSSLSSHALPRQKYSRGPGFFPTCNMRDRTYQSLPCTLTNTTCTYIESRTKPLFPAVHEAHTHSRIHTQLPARLPCHLSAALYEEKRVEEQKEKTTQSASSHHPLSLSMYLGLCQQLAYV